VAEATFYGVRVVQSQNRDCAIMYRSLHEFEQPAAEPPPFPSVF